MISMKVKDEIIEKFLANAKETFDATNGKHDVEALMAEGNEYSVKEFVNSYIDGIMISSIPEGVGIPKISKYVTCVSNNGEEGISVVNVTIKNKISGTKKFSFASPFTKNNIKSSMFNWFLNVYQILVTDMLAEENLVKVNEVLAQMVEAAGLDYSIEVVTPICMGGKKIASMADDKVVFVADMNKVFALDSIVILLDEEDQVVPQATVKKYFDKMVETLSTAQTVEQLIGIRGGDLVAFVCDISKRLKAKTLIKQVCSKNAQRLYGNKDTLAYFEDGDVFAIVSRTDGQFEIVLSPFDINTLHKVDYDVLGALA